MISLQLAPETERLRREVREWSISEVRPYARQVDRDHAAPPQDIVDKIMDCAPVKIFATTVEEEGVGQGRAVHSTLFVSELAYGDQWLNWEMPGSGIGYGSIRKLGTAEQQERWLPGLKDGTYNRAAFALTEPHFGSDPAQIATTATRDGDTWVLNGTKIYCTGGATSDLVVVYATIDKSLGRNGVRGFVLDQGTPGMIIAKRNEDKLGIRSSSTSELHFVDCVLPLDRCLGWPENDGAEPPSGAKKQRLSGFQGAVSTLDGSRPGIAAISLGLARASIDETRGWFEDRRQYLTPERRDRIETDLERLDHRIECSRLAVTRAAWMADQHCDNRVEASIAKAHGPLVAERAIRRCMEIMGPDGWSEEYLVEKWYRDVKIFDIFEGSGQIQRVVIGRNLMGAAARA